jgi:hypothetical protein
MFRLKDKSYLAIIGRLLLILVVLFLLGNGYAALRMELARTKMNRLAQQLGYLPTTRLVGGLSNSDVSIVTGTATAGLGLYFLTPMTLTEFQGQLGAIAPNANEFPFGNTNRILDMFTVDGIKGWQLKNRHLMPEVPQHCWGDLSGFSGQNIFICLHETAEVDYYLEFNGKHVTDNVVHISIYAAVIPVWMQFGVVLWAYFRGY